MPRETLRLLEADVERLLFAGGAAAGADEGLQARGRSLAASGTRVPALARLADQLARVTSAAPRAAARELFTLAALVAQVRGAQALPGGVDGALDPLPPGPAVASPLTAEDAEALHRALTRHAGEGRVEAIREAAGRGAVGDLRLMDAWIGALGDPSLGGVVAREVLPRLGDSVAGALRGALALDGGVVDSRRLLCLAAIEGAAARPLVERAITEGAAQVRAGALEALGLLDPMAAAEAALGMAGTDRASEVRVAAVTVLGANGSDAALGALLAALGDEAAAVARAAAEALSGFAHPGTTARVAGLLTPEALEVRRVGTGAGRGQGKLTPAQQQEAMREEQTEARRVEAQVRYLDQVLGVLARRGGPEAATAAVAVLDHPHPGVRDAACGVVVALRDPAGLSALAGWLESPDQGRRQVAVRAVFALGPTAAYERLAGWLTPEALAEGGGPTVADLFEQLLYGEAAKQVDPRWADRALALLDDAGARGWAIDYLRERQDPRALDAFVARLADAEADHASLLDAVGELGNRRATAAVVAVLGAPEVPLWWVLHALERLDDPAAVEPLRAFAVARERDADVVRQVESLVGRLGRDRTLDGA